MIDGPTVNAEPEAARRLDEIASNAVTAPASASIEGWWCKATPGVEIRRGNTALPPSGRLGTDFDRSSLRSVESWYRSQRATPRVAVSTAEPAWQVLDDLLAGRGYLADAVADLMTVPVSDVVEHASASAERLGSSVDEGALEITVRPGIEEPDDRTLDAIAADEAAREHSRSLAGLLAHAGSAAMTGVVEISGEPVGLAFGVHERGHLGIFGLRTAERWRRRGVAGALIGALAKGGELVGVDVVYLQVEVENRASRSLVEGLGFTASHRYHYRVKDLR